MKQLTQNLKSGLMELLDVPSPTVQKGRVIVRVHYSLISAGTEGGKVKTARSSLIQKAKQKPDQVKQVLDSVKVEGVKSTYNKVMNKLDFPSPLGYSCAGEVVEIGEDCKDLKIGDMVACGGETAVHAQMVSVPYNLCVKIPNNVDLKNACFTTVASIAMQGFRQADLKLGEVCVVIGLGLIGQLTIQLLNAAGVAAIGIDIDEVMVKLAQKSGAKISITRNDDKLEDIILNASNGFGVDAVIITAGTSSTDPVELAGRLCRRKGKVVIVGAVPTGFSRPSYYKKELELRMSSSYGPGRYDDNYEEKGYDYPIGYVRWTENRNMGAFIDLISKGALNIELLTSHVINFDNALSAYDLILNKEEQFTGIVLKYDPNQKIEGSIKISNLDQKPDALNIGFIGAGSFAQKFLLPNIPNSVSKISVATSSGNSSVNVAKKYGFTNATTNALDVLKNKSINTVFIATRHNTHGEYVIEALKQKKNVFVEKPLTLKPTELEEIKNVYNKQNVQLMVGYNRRFAPLTEKLLGFVGRDTQKAINYRINVGNIPAEHWTQDQEVGGGRILGEVCHFIDLCMFIANSEPTSVTAFSLDDPKNLQDTLNISLKFKNGSIANISYFANGSKDLSKEYLEVYSNGVTAVLNDFKLLEIYGNSKKVFKSNQNKGHAKEVKAFLSAVETGHSMPIGFKDIYNTSLITFKVIESIQQGQTIKLN